MEVSVLIGEASGNAFSGPARYGHSLATGLADRGILCHVHTFSWGTADSINANLDVQVYSPIVSVSNFRISPRLARSALSGLGDIAQVHGVRNFQCEIGTIASALQGRPLVVVPHGSLLGYRKAYSKRQGRFLRAIYDLTTLRASTRYASAVVVTSRVEEQDAVEFGIPKNKIVRIPYGIYLPSTALMKAERVERNTKVVLTVSRLTAKNNLEFLIRGFAKALREGAHLRLVVVGGAKASGLSPEESEYHRRLLKLIGELQVGENVAFAGWKVGEDLWRQYQSADVFAWTSRYDNFSRALVEAAWFGLPIVSTPVGIAPELLADGEGGEVIEHGDCEGLANALVRLTHNRTYDALDARRSHEKAAEFTVEKMVSGYIDLYERLVGAGAR